MELTQKEKDTITDLVKACELAIFESTGKKVNLFFQHKVVEKTKLTMEQVTDIVCRELEVDYHKVFEKTRVRNVVEARQIAMYLCYINCNKSLKQIGRFFGGRDHSTVLHSREVVGNHIQTEIDYRNKFKQIEFELLTAQTFNN